MFQEALFVGEMTLLSPSSLDDHPLRIKYYYQIHLEKLQQSIRDDGIVTPLVVWKEPSGKKYIIINGHYRIRAARRLKIKGVPCRIIVGDEACSVRTYCHSHTLTRSLNPLEEAQIIEELIRKGYTMKTIGSFFTHGKSWVSKRYGLLKKLDPNIKRLLKEGKLVPGIAQELTKVSPGNREQERLLNLLQKNKSTRDETVSFVNWWLRSTEEEKEEAEKTECLSLSQLINPKQQAMEKLESFTTLATELHDLLESHADPKNWWPKEVWTHAYLVVERLITEVQARTRGEP